MRLEIPEYRFDLKTPEFQKSDDGFTIWFLEGVLDKYPTYVECLMYLGNAYTTTGMYEKGLEVDLKLEKLRPEDPLVHYNLACSLSLVEMLNESLEALEKAIDLGYNDLEHLVNDSDLDGVKDEEGYKVLIHKLKKSSRKNV
ncbi:MAG TPA: hypothetical protein QF423_04685 [Candidatus Scalindua sp.]|jgi:tetratricopeptide (TPR) repeat protein|nr:hypothetical protein [Candidatus Scalindua sp.]